MILTDCYPVQISDSINYIRILRSLPVPVFGWTSLILFFALIGAFLSKTRDMGPIKELQPDSIPIQNMAGSWMMSGIGRLSSSQLDIRFSHWTLVFRQWWGILSKR